MIITLNLDVKVMIMAHYTSKVYEYVVANATMLQLDPILDYARAIARVAGPGTSIYKDMLKAINMLGYMNWKDLKAGEIWFGLVEKLPYAERVMTKEVRKMIGVFMTTIIDNGLMDYNLSPPATHQDELPGELFLTMVFNPSKERSRSEELMNNVNVEIFQSKVFER